MISQHYKPRKPGILDTRIACAKLDAIEATYGASRESKVAVLVLLYGGTLKAVRASLRPFWPVTLTRWTVMPSLTPIRSTGHQ